MSDIFPAFLDHLVAAEEATRVSADNSARAQEERIRKIIEGQTEAARGFVTDEARYLSLRCPRRAGKSFAMASKAVLVGEMRPGSRILVISLTLKSTKENYWTGAPSGVFRMDQMFGLGLKYHHTDLVWWHQNGSRGRLAGAETKADIEYLRGAAAEADVVILDECKSFSPDILDELIRDVLEPGLMTRDGQLVMGGTPGLSPRGAFYEATCEAARNEGGRPTCVPAGVSVEEYLAKHSIHQDSKVVDTAAPPEEDEEAAADEPWILHSWTVKHNTAAPKQWKRALRIKARAGWANDHPTWRREFLGEWVWDGEGLVYAYSACKANPDKFVTWHPRADILAHGNLTGLDPAEGPWHLVLGMDLGYEDDTAMVLAAYSERLAELRHVWDYKSPHLTVDDVAEKVNWVIKRFGAPDAIVADASGLGLQVVATLNQVHGLPVQAAEKKEKFDFIELLNSDFHCSRIKIVPGSDLELELLALHFDLSKDSKAKLARQGKLKEDPKCPNHLCDAFLYLWRYSYHTFARPIAVVTDPKSLEARLAKEREVETRLARRRDPAARIFTSDGYPGVRDSRPLDRTDLLIRSGGFMRN